MWHGNQEDWCWCSSGSTGSWWVTWGEQTGRHGLHSPQCWKHELAASCRCHSQWCKCPFHTLMTSTRIYQQHPYAWHLNTYQPREKTLQAPNSTMNTSHHTHHHHPLQQVTLPCPHPHSSKFLHCQTKFFIHHLNLSQVGGPELACILDLKPHK